MAVYLRKNDEVTKAGVVSGNGAAAGAVQAAKSPLATTTTTTLPATPTTKKTTTTSTNNLRRGSEGVGVSAFQTLLNQLGGYNLEVDGKFGPKTEAAVRDWQQKNGLDVDGVVGTQTWGSLTSASTPAATAPTFSYTPSDNVTQADVLLQEHMSKKPGKWQGGTWQDTLNETISQILNRDKFSYDLNGDALYQQYKDQYVQQGKLAMMDTMGQAQAMTGGYGNSYAQTAGQQAYQGYLQQLNEVVPELYGMALDQYNQEGQNLYNQVGLLAQMEDQEYGKYRDQLSDYYTDLNYLTENARYMSETEYQKALDDFNIKYGAYRDAVSDEQWQKQFDFAGEQWGWQKKQAAAVGGSGGGNDGGTEFHKATYSRPDSDGNLIWYINGKEVVREPGANPYTGTVNPDVKYGYFPNSYGYQPDNLGTYEVNGKEVVNKLSKTGMTDVVNGVTQNVWRDQKDGKLWIWDGTQNEYLQYQE